jgi:diadenylate cyclase
MTDILRIVIADLQRLDVRSGLDILIIAGLFYWLLLLLRRTTAMALLRGAAIILTAAVVLGRLFDLRVLNWLVRNSLTGLLIAVPIIFQPEIRRALERLGRTSARGLLARPDHGSVVHAVSRACQRLARQRLGALVVIERETGLEEYLDSGTRLDALATPELIESLFQKGSPLHDGAVVIRGRRVVSAGCTLPLAVGELPFHAGTRHRAGLGITEVTDALCIIVSEETGQITLAMNGRMYPDIDADSLHRMIGRLLVVPRRAEASASPDGDAEASARLRVGGREGL